MPLIVENPAGSWPKRALDVKRTTCFAVWSAVGALLGWLVWERLTLGFWALWFVPLAWGATASAAEAGALMVGYYGGALTGSVVALSLFEGAWAGPLGWLACAALLGAPWALARAGYVGRYFPRAGEPLRYIVALLVVSLPPLGALGMASPWVAATASFPGMGLWGLALALPASAMLVSVGARLRIAATSDYKWRRPGRRELAWGAAALILVTPGAVVPTLPTVPPARLVTINTHNWEPAGKPALAHVLRQNRQLIQGLATRIARSPAHMTFILPEDAAVHWSPFTAWAWWPLALKAYRHHDTVALGVYMRPAGDTEKRDGLLLMGRRAGLVTARQPMPVTEWRPFMRSGARAHWWRWGATKVFGRPAAVLVCYEQLLVWPVAEAFVGHPAPTVLIGVSDHWWVEPGTADATEVRMQAAVLRAWGRLYGVPVLLADNRPHVGPDRRANRALAMAAPVTVRPIRTEYGQNTDKPEQNEKTEPKKSRLKRPIRAIYGQNTDRIRTSHKNMPIGIDQRPYGASTASPKNYRVMALAHMPSPRTLTPGARP